MPQPHPEPPAAPPGARRSRGFTLIELCIVAAVVGILSSVAWPSYREHLQRARRADAVAALTRVHIAQEQYRARHGQYAPSLAALTGAGAPISPEGFYEIALDPPAGVTVTVAALARAGGAQAADRDCLRITLTLQDGVAEHGPHARCWGR